jgi:hypothetical protein
VESLIAVTVNKLLAKLQTVFGVIPEVPFEDESYRIKQIILFKIMLSDKVPGLPATAKVSVPLVARVIIPPAFETLFA